MTEEKVVNPPKVFHTIRLVIGTTDFNEADEIKCKVLKFLEKEGIHVFQTKTKTERGWNTL